MNHFEYRDGQLFAEEIAIADIAAAVGTPFYCYSTATLTRHYQVFASALATVGARICECLRRSNSKENGFRGLKLIFRVSSPSVRE